MGRRGTNLRFASSLNQLAPHAATVRTTPRFSFFICCFRSVKRFKMAFAHRRAVFTLPFLKRKVPWKRSNFYLSRSFAFASHFKTLNALRRHKALQSAVIHRVYRNFTTARRIALSCYRAFKKNHAKFTHKRCIALLHHRTNYKIATCLAHSPLYQQHYRIKSWLSLLCAPTNIAE